ncbi:MAG: 50S ribosomal protein L4 [Planctomycetota bacterium]
MIEVQVFDQDGQEVEKFSFDEASLGGKVRKQLLHDVIVMYEAARRVGTSKVKDKGERAGSGKKPWRQKGTGNARAGMRRSPLWRKGGRTFGPKPREYRYSIPKKIRRQALQSAVLSKFLDREAVVVRDIVIPEPKTRHVARILRNLKIDRSCLVGVEKAEPLIYRAARNIPRLSVRPVADFNAYEVLQKRRLLLTKAALERIIRGVDAAGAPAA